MGGEKTEEEGEKFEDERDVKGDVDDDDAEEEEDDDDDADDDDDEDDDDEEDDEAKETGCFDSRDE